MGKPAHDDASLCTKCTDPNQPGYPAAVNVGGIYVTNPRDLS
jgi:hypothetical protein